MLIVVVAHGDHFPYFLESVGNNNFWLWLNHFYMGYRILAYESFLRKPAEKAGKSNKVMVDS